MLRKSYYVTLGVSHNESADGIRRAFCELVKRYHPDRVGRERLHFFQDLLEAYHVLSVPERRKQYDQGLYHADSRTGAPPAPVVVGAESQADLPQAAPVLRTVSINAASFEAALALVSGSLTVGEATPKGHCEGLNAEVILSPDEARQGGVVFLTVPSCSPCERCGGSGREGLFPCGLCDGEGLLEEQERVRIHVPPEVGDATVMEVPLRGLGVHNFYLRLRLRVGL
jgi:DnaJ-class molecular chaperone